jgi:two-component system, LytTR family, response regulator
MSDKLKVLIVEDEKLAREIVKNYLKKFDNIDIVGECSNGFDALKQINEDKPDIVFLDIQMPKLTGFEMLEVLENPPVIIFTTAYDQYALKAFEVNATDYLLKPFSEERFNEAVQKAIKLLGNKNHVVKDLEELSKTLENKEEFLERVVVKNGQKISIIPIGDIKYIEAQDDYTMLYTDKENFLKQKTMKYFEGSLDPKDFIRIHRSYFVKVTQIKQIELFEKESYRVILNEGTKLPVSKSGYQKLKEILN